MWMSDRWRWAARIVLFMDMMLSVVMFKVMLQKVFVVGVKMRIFLDMSKVILNGTFARHSELFIVQPSESQEDNAIIVGLLWVLLVWILLLFFTTMVFVELWSAIRLFKAITPEGKRLNSLTRAMRWKSMVSTLLAVEFALYTVTIMFIPLILMIVRLGIAIFAWILVNKLRRFSF